MVYIGYFAAVLTTISFLPQVIHTIKIKDTRSISLTMYSMFFVGTICWLIYGVIIHSLPVILANGITMLLAGIILIMKIKNLKKEK